MLKSVFSNWSNIVLSALSVFILYPFFIKVLGEQQYGVWLLITSLTGYFSLLQLGVPLANVRYVSKYHAENDMEKINQVLSSNLAFFVLLAFVVLTSGLAVSFFLDLFFKVPTEMAVVAQIAAVLASLDIALKFVFEVFEGLLNGLQKFVPLNAVKNVGVVVRVACTYFLVTGSFGIVRLAVILVVLTIIQGTLFYFMSRTYLPTLRISLSGLNKNVYKDVAKYSIYVLILQAGARISFQTDAIVIGSFLSVSAIVWFSISNNILLYLMQFITGISQALMPNVSALEAKGELSSLKSAYINYSRIIFMLLIPVGIVLMVFGDQLIGLWMGPKYSEVSGDILTILTSSYLFFLVQRGVAFPILMGTSRLKFLSGLMVATGLLNLVLSIWLSRYFGLYGVAWGTAIPNLVNVVAIVVYMCRCLDVSLYHYLVKTMLLPAAVGLAGLTLTLLSKSVLRPDSYATICMSAGLGTAGYLLMVKYLFYSRSYKAALNS